MPLVNASVANPPGSTRPVGTQPASTVDGTCLPSVSRLVVEERTCRQKGSRKLDLLASQVPSSLAQALDRLKERRACFGDARDVTMIGAAAAAHHVEPWQTTHQSRIIAAKFGRITWIELGRLVKLGM